MPGLSGPRFSHVFSGKRITSHLCTGLLWASVPHASTSKYHTSPPMNLANSRPQFLHVPTRNITRSHSYIWQRLASSGLCFLICATGESWLFTSEQTAGLDLCLPICSIDRNIPEGLWNDGSAQPGR